MAQAEADRILDDARAEASLLLVRAEQQASAHAIELVKTLQDAQRKFLDRSQEMVIDLTQSMFDRLVMDLTPRKKLEAALRRVQREAPPRLAAPLLRVHPDDLELLPVVEWEVKADAAMSRGMCRLEASNGEWCVDFSAGVTALKASLAQGSGNHPA
ncbi:MAG: flagellar biosynthesis/type III secretory pathway protein [Herminiimonas sp.]|nr:flagellar biosynthesis/type III secretory pathway protein [Herminiimonas sp.]